jgi:hypothetical protein
MDVIPKIPAASKAVPVTEDTAITTVYSIPKGRVFHLEGCHLTNLKDAQSRVMLYDGTTTTGVTPVVDVLVAASVTVVLGKDDLGEANEFYAETVSAYVSLATVTVKVFGKESPGED